MATEATQHGRRADVAEATRATEATMRIDTDVAYGQCSGDDGRLHASQPRHLYRPQTVPVNVYETDGAVVVVAPLPAVRPDDVHIDLWPGKLRITAQLRSSGPRDYLVHEWEYGGFERELEVPTGFGSGIEASLTNGQLAVRVLRGHNNDKLSISPTPH